MLFHELGHDRVLALQLGFELLDLAILGVLDGLGLAAVVEGGWPFSKNSLSQLVELVGVDVEFIAQVGDGDLVDEVPFEDGDLLRSGKVATRCLSVMTKPPFEVMLTRTERSSRFD